MKTPDPYQIEGAQFLASRKRACLFDEMGLGKTLQAIVATAIVRPSPSVRVVCNASAVPVWEMAFEQEWMRFSDLRFNIMSYEGCVKYMRDPHTRDTLFDVLICDEAHYVKNQKAKRSQAVEQLAKRAEYAWGMTGTPALSNLGEMYNLLRLFAPDSIKDIKSEMEFWQRYTYVRDTEYGPKPTGRRNVAELKARIKGHVLRRVDGEDGIDLHLPPVRWGDIALRGPDVPLSDGDADRLRQAAALIEIGGVPSAHETSMTTTRRWLEVAKAKPLADYLKDELKNSPADHKIVIFGWFNEALNIIEDELQEFGVCRISGSSNKAARAAAVSDFQSGSERVFVGQILAAGSSITLTAANQLVFLGLDWVPGNNAQAAKRVRRRGQTRSVLIRTATLLGTLDGVVQEVVARRTKDIMSVWTDEEENS